jgi:hypothetical protein
MGGTGGAGGATGAGGAAGAGGGMGGTGGAAGAGGGMGGMGGAAGMGGAGGCRGVYCDDFESDTVGAMAVGWTRVGGSSGDWEVRADASKTFAQDHAESSTFRVGYSSGATGAPWSGATTVSATVQVLAFPMSGTPTATVCVRYTVAGDFECLALEPGVGAQAQTKVGGATSNGQVWAATIATGTAVTVSLAINATGTLTASLNGTQLGTFTPAATIASGFVAVTTQSCEAEFDNIVVTQP